ncbi:MAG: hypothetical protein VZR00_07220 [Lachnospiraceae bacterium]|nr:hypothetical protein [Lachnospiraceae bacterium]MEE3461659.1 hypothetical protein [Lachnospiraceae bacterium]
MIERKIKYALLVLQMLFLGPVFPRLLEPLIDTTTDLYMYADMFNLGPVNIYKPMNLMFGYDLQSEKILVGLLFLVSLAVFFLILDNKNVIGKVVMTAAVGSIISGVFLNMNYIYGKYDYYCATDDYNIYQKKTDNDPKYFLDYHINNENISINDRNSLSFKAELKVSVNESSEYLTCVLYNRFSTKIKLILT